jgi:hypothetical protein
MLKVDTERFPELASRYNVQGTPNFALFNRVQLQQAGLVDANTMKSWLAAKRLRIESSQMPESPRMHLGIASCILFGYD